ncbi:MAG TPA: chemotaxis protein CheB, partial [Thermoanaerobaculia bacterium]|nr:chemotaxis protein CheB [Thermoanaerobaculia bacterium]
IVLGASAGGVRAICEVIGSWPAELPAAIFVVLHTTPHSPSLLPAIFARASRLPASHPAEGEAIRPGWVYVAPPDHHLAIADGHVHLSRNARENGHRPAIDVLFRTAARHYGPRVVGVVLTGNLDDGTAGLAAIKQCGGVAVVQDPEDADYPSMPESAIANVAVDHVLPLAEIGPRLEELLRQPPAEAADCDEVEEEPDAMGTAKKADAAGTPLEVPGDPSGLTCPECGGALFEQPGERPLHFRCRTGHAYSPESLLAKQSESLEAAFWAALRSLEENATLSRRMEKRARQHGHRRACEGYQQRAEDAEKHAALIRAILEKGGAELE